MNDFYEIVRQDFAATMAAWNEGDYSHMNVYSNRLMGNCVFGAKKEYGVVGFFLKDMAIDCLRTANNSDLQSALKPFASGFISKLNEALKPEPELAQIWQGYFSYVDGTRKVFLQPSEKQAYKDNKTFTAAAFEVLVGEFLQGEALFEEHGQGVKGFLHEADRLIRNHGAEEKDLVFGALVTGLDRLLDYVKVGCSSHGADWLKTNLMPWLERIGNWRVRNESLPYSTASEILSDLVVEWRRYFIRYGELGRTGVTEERKIELPTEAKKRLGDTIAEALRKDLGKSKK